MRSDGVGYGWIDGLKDYAEKQVTDEELASAAAKFPYNTPDTKEAYLFRKIFESLFHVLLPRHQASKGLAFKPADRV